MTNGTPASDPNASVNHVLGTGAGAIIGGLGTAAIASAAVAAGLLTGGLGTVAIAAAPWVGAWFGGQVGHNMTKPAGT
jgi:hypothetical protein